MNAKDPREANGTRAFASPLSGAGIRILPKRARWLKPEDAELGELYLCDFKAMGVTPSI